MRACPTEAELRQLLDEECAETGREGLEAHVEACPLCQATIARLSAEEGGLDLRYLRGPCTLPPESDSDLVHRLQDTPLVESTPSLTEGNGAGPIAFPGGPTDKGPLGQLESYQIRRELGQGRFGIVYEAYDELDRLVAIKILKPELAASARERLRFEHEARKAAAVKHDHIVTLHRVGHTPGFPLPYLVMEYVDGEPLSDRLEREGVLEAKEAARIVRQLALALAAAHARGLVHRDIKPSNVLLEASTGRAKLTDFGLARATEVVSVSTSQSGRIVGSPAYMSPEQIAAPSKIDGRSDIYSLGVVLYELLTGERPFRGPAHLLLQLVVHDEPRPLRKLNDSIPRDLETICHKAMAKAPARRYPTARDLADDLGRWLDGKPIQARPVGQLERLWRWSKRNPAVASLTAAVFTLLVTVAAVASVGYVREVAQRKAAEAAHEETRREWYAMSIHAMQQAWDSGRVNRLRRLLVETEAYPDRGFEWYYCQHLCHLDWRTLIGHRLRVTAVSWSPDGKWLATGSEDGTAKIWEVAAGRELVTLRGHTSGLRSVCWSPDGKRLATASEDGTGKVWEVSGGREVITLKGHRDVVHSLSWSPDGKRLATGSEDGTAVIWDASNGRELRSIKADKSKVWPVSWSPDSRYLATGGWDGLAKVWDAANGRKLLTFQGHAGPVLSVSWSPDGKWLATASRDGTVKVWEAVLGRELFTLKGHRNEVRSVSWSPNGKWLATGSEDGMAMVWHALGGPEHLSIKGHTGVVYSVSWSPDGKWLATGSDDGTTKIWDVASGPELHTLKGHADVVRSVSWSPDPDGKWLATGSEDGTAKVWDAASGHEMCTLKGHARKVWSVSWSPDGRWLATASEDGTAKVWDAANGRELHTLKDHISKVRSVSWSPDGKWLATGSEDGTAKVWDAASGRELRSLKGASGLQSVSWSPDGKWLATGSNDGKAKVWEAASGRELFTLMGHTGGVGSVSWSWDGKRLATGSSDSTAKVWEAWSGRELLTLQGHTRGVWSVSWSPDGKRLVTGSDDGTAKVWDASSGRELLTFQGHTRALVSVSWSPDGKRLATGSKDGTAKVWEAASPEAVDEWARQTRELEELWTRNAFRGPHAQGFIQKWLLLLPPFHLASGESADQALDRQQVRGEAQLRPWPGQPVSVARREFIWREYRSPGAVVDFNAALGQVTEWSVIYAVCYLESDRARKDLWLQVCSDDQAKVYLNGKEVYQWRQYRNLDSLDTVPVALEQGTNVLLFKVVNATEDWRGCMRLVDAEGLPAKGIGVKLTPK